MRLTVIKLTIYHTKDEHANHYNTDAIDRDRTHDLPH
jgi:hypothetical protein